MPQPITIFRFLSAGVEYYTLGAMPLLSQDPHCSEKCGNRQRFWLCYNTSFHTITRTLSEAYIHFLPTFWTLLMKHNEEQNKPTICLFRKQTRGTLRCPKGLKTIQNTFKRLHLYWYILDLS